MSNADLILLLGIGLVLVAVAVLIPAGVVRRGDGVAAPARPPAWWLPLVLAAGSGALGLVALLAVAFRGD